MKKLPLLILFIFLSGCHSIPRKLSLSEKRMIEKVYVPKTVFFDSRLEVGFSGASSNTPEQVFWFGESTYDRQQHQKMDRAARNQIRSSLRRYLFDHLRQSGLPAAAAEKEISESQAGFVFRVRRFSILGGNIFSGKKTPELQMDAWLVMNPPFTAENRRFLVTSKLNIGEPDKHPIVWHKLIWVKAPAKYTTEEFLADTDKLEEGFDEVTRLAVEALIEDFTDWMQE